MLQSCKALTNKIAAAVVNNPEENGFLITGSVEPLLAAAKQMVVR